MNSDNNSTLQTKPFYKRPKFYVLAILSTLAGLFLLLVLSVIALRWINPSATSFTYQQNWDELGVERYSLREHWVEYDNLPEHASWAVVAAEDQIFWEHWGFDVKSIREAWEDRQDGVRSRGASSITQQVAKNIYLSPSETLFRKGIEAGITILIELFWPKERIIEVYLNVAEFGPGVFGIGKASHQFFDLTAKQLEPEMTAQLAAVLPSPKRMRVNPPSPFAKERSEWILKQMTQLSGIAYHQPEKPADSTPQLMSLPVQADPLAMNGEDDYHFSKLDSLITSINSDNFAVSDTSDTVSVEDSLPDQ